MSTKMSAVESTTATLITMEGKVESLESVIELKASTAELAKTILDTRTKAEERVAGLEGVLEALRGEVAEGSEQSSSKLVGMDKKIKSIVDMLSEQSVELESEIQETRKLINESETRAAAEWKKIAVESKVDSSRVSAVVQSEIARSVRACQQELQQAALLLEAEVDGRLHATENKFKGLTEKIFEELDPDVKHLQEEYAQTKVTMMMVKSEAAEEHHATDTILRVILEIVSVGEMTETRQKAVAALSKIQSDREDALEKRKIVQTTPERLRKTFAGVGAAVIASNEMANLKMDVDMRRHSFAGGAGAGGGGGGSPQTSPSKALSPSRGGGGAGGASGGLAVSAKTHSLDIVITEERQRESDRQVEYAVDVFEIGRDFVNRTW